MFAHTPGCVRSPLLLPLACALSCLPCRAPAQWSPDPAVNMRICDVSGEQSVPKARATSDGGLYVSWFDNRDGGYAMYLQRLDSAGLPHWTADGLLISAHPQNTWLVDYDLAVDAEDNAVLVFCDVRGGGEFTPVAYKISPQGTFLWGADGIALSDSPQVFQAAPRIAVAADGSATITWSYLSVPNRVALQRMSAAGTKLWGDQPLLLSGSGQEHLTHPSVVASDSGAVILLWSGYTGSFLNPQNYRLYSQKFSPQAQPLWGPAPDTVYGLGRVSGFFVPALASDAEGGALYGWHDDRSMMNLSMSYLQHITAAGVHRFPPNGSAVSSASGNNHFDVAMARIPATGEIVAAWTETNALQTLAGLTAQKFSPAGERLWGAAGLPIVPPSGNGVAYVNVATLDTSALLWWSDLFMGGTDGALRGVRLHRLGVRLWGDSVRTVSRAPGEKLHPAVALDGRGVSTLVWSDRRSDMGGIYGQTVRPDGSLGNPPVPVLAEVPPAEGFALAECYPNPFNPTTTIRWSVPEGGPFTASLRVTNILGERIATLVEGSVAAGTHETVFDAAGLAAGVYYSTLTVTPRGAGEGYRATKRMLLVK